MEFEYDQLKSELNKSKHGIDFEEAQGLWKDSRGLVIPVAHDEEERFVLISFFDSKHWTAVFTIREQRIRLISVRRSRVKEVDLYDNCERI